MISYGILICLFLPPTVLLSIQNTSVLSCVICISISEQQTKTNWWEHFNSVIHCCSVLGGD
ncbi:hypothetical protein ACFLVO_04360 [Chloroflexota bacterium]